MPNLGRAVFALLATIVGGAALAAAPLVTGIGGMEGTRYIPGSANASYEPSEDVAIDFAAPADLTSFRAALSIDPAVTPRLYPSNYGKRVALTFRKTPGVTYHVHVAPGVHLANGASTTQPIELTVQTRDDPIPAPLRATPGEPYRYGVLAHPFPFSLTGPNAERIVDLMAQAGVRFVRIDYPGELIEKQAGKYDWSVEDHVAAMLAAHGITELPIILQYSAPKWANGNAAYPAIWQQPESYAQFAGAVAAHLRVTLPHITRVELFNEPNLDGWWKNTNPAFAATDGSATAAYMRGAYAAIKRAAPGLTVVGPALASGGKEVDPRTFFTTLYTDGCKRGACWDVLSVHNYRWMNPTFPAPESAPNRFDIYRAILDIAAQHGDPGTHVMLTEWGYSTQNSPDGVDPQVQARFLALGFNLMLADPAVDGIVYVNLYNPATDFWGQTALVSPDFTPKPAFFVFREFARDTR